MCLDCYVKEMVPPPAGETAESIMMDLLAFHFFSQSPEFKTSYCRINYDT